MTTNENKEELKVNFYSFIVVALCALTWGVSFISRNVWSSAIASEATLVNLGITAVQAGGIATAFYIGYVISNFISGWLIDAIGAKKSLAITALGTGVATLLIPVTSGYWAMFLLRVLAGVFAGPLFSCITKFNYAYFPDQNRAVVTGLMGAGPAIGSAIASITFTPMVATRGYKVAFLWAGIVTFAVGAIVWIVLKDRGVTLPAKNMDISEEDKKNFTANALKVFMKKDFLIGSATHFAFLCASIGLATWMLAYLVNENGMAPATAGLVFGGAQLIGLVSGTLGGILSDVFKTRKWLMIIFALIGGLGLVLFTTLKSVGALTVCYSITNLCQAMAGTCSNTMQIERAKGPYSGKVMGWYNAICQLGSVTIPLVTGAVLDSTGSYKNVLFTIAAVLIIPVVLGLLVKDTYVKKQ